MKRPVEDFIIRSYKQGDEGAINNLFCEVFHQTRGLDHWFWKYRDNPYGSYIISLALSPDKEVAAHYAGYPVRLLYYPSEGSPPEESTICQLGDKMTSPAYRSVGFGASSLMAKTFMHFKGAFDNLFFSYGFLTHHSLRFGLLLLNYRIIEPVMYRKIGLDRLRSPGSRNTIEKLLTPVRVQEAAGIDETWTKFFYDAAPHYCHLIKRDRQYLTWRYLSRPDKKYLLIVARRFSRITGWSVFHREGNSIIWGDALFSPGDAGSVKSVLAFLAGHAIAQGADTLEGWFPEKPGWWNLILDELGFTSGPEPNNLRFCIVNFPREEVPERLAGSFYYTMGDSDLF